MSCHGVLNWVKNDETLPYVPNVDGSCFTIRFEYPEPILHHNGWWHQQLTPWSHCTLWSLEDKVGTYQRIYISFGGGRRKCSKYKGSTKETKCRTSIGFPLCLDWNNLDDDWKTVVQVGRPVTQRSLEIVKIKHIMEKRLGLPRAWDENDHDWGSARNEHQKTHWSTPGCPNGVRAIKMTIMHLSMAQQKIPLNRLPAKSKLHVLDCCISNCSGTSLVQF